MLFHLKYTQSPPCVSSDSKTARPYVESPRNLQARWFIRRSPHSRGLESKKPTVDQKRQVHCKDHPIETRRSITTTLRHPKLPRNGGQKTHNRDTLGSAGHLQQATWMIASKLLEIFLPKPGETPASPKCTPTFSYQTIFFVAYLSCPYRFFSGDLQKCWLW